MVEFKLGIRGQAGLPARDSDEWCQLMAWVDTLLAAVNRLSEEEDIHFLRIGGGALMDAVPLAGAVSKTPR